MARMCVCANELLFVLCEFVASVMFFFSRWRQRHDVGSFPPTPPERKRELDHYQNPSSPGLTEAALSLRCIASLFAINVVFILKIQFNCIWISNRVSGLN